jgi:hypothetical protein
MVDRCHDLSKGRFGKIPGVRMGLWIVWKGTSWYGVGKWLDWKVSVVWCGLEGISFVECNAQIS